MVHQLRRKNNQKWRHTKGLLLLSVTVVLWTSSNFLASSIFADETYSKPFLLTYINTFFFIFPLVPILIRLYRRDKSQFEFLRCLWQASRRPLQLCLDEQRQPTEKLSLYEIVKLSLEFSFLWFLANYFAAACLEYTSVASSTLLTSTSGIWTLLIGTLFAVEKFTFPKLLGVFASLAGIALTSTLDLSGESEGNRGRFPSKSFSETAIGDSMAFISAVLYGIYTVLMKKRIHHEDRVNMPLFFGLVGLINLLLLWPAIVLLHFTGIEKFELPPTNLILFILLINSLASLVSDICWGYATLLTSPLIATVGLSLTIPLSLVGQIIFLSQYASLAYWLGAIIVIGSFIFISIEDSKEVESVDSVNMHYSDHGEPNTPPRGDDAG